jgi:hypothetical protein
MSKEWTKKVSLEEFWNCVHLEDEEREDLEIRGCTRNWLLEMGRQRGAKKKNKFILGTERCYNIKNLYINKIYNRQKESSKTRKGTDLQLK